MIKDTFVTFPASTVPKVARLRSLEVTTVQQTKSVSTLMAAMHVVLHVHKERNVILMDGAVLSINAPMALNVRNSKKSVLQHKAQRVSAVNATKAGGEIHSMIPVSMLTNVNLERINVSEMEKSVLIL